MRPETIQIEVSDLRKGGNARLMLSTEQETCADNSDAWVKLDPEKSIEFSICRDAPVKKVTSARAILRKNSSQSYLNQVLSSGEKKKIHEKLHKITRHKKLLSPRDLNQSALIPSSDRVSPLARLDYRSNLNSIIDENNPLTVS